MATLTVWKFDDPAAADEVLARLGALQKQELIQVEDAAVVSWPAHRKKPVTRQETDLTAVGGVGGAFWGLLFGIIFFVPLLGMAVGAATGALAGHLSDVGIDDDFIAGVRDQVTPGTSALFLMSSGAVMDRVSAELSDVRGHLISTNLSEDDEAALRKAFADE